MEVSVSAIFSRFSIFVSTSEAEKYEHTIDLLSLAKNGWNVELHRSRSWIPTHCTVRLPPLAVISFCVNNTEESPEKFPKKEIVDEEHYKNAFVHDSSAESKSDVLTGVVLTVNKAGLIEMITSRNVEITQFVARHVKQMLRRWLEFEVECLPEEWEEEQSLKHYMSTETLLSPQKILESSPSRITDDNDKDVSFRVVFFNCILKPLPHELQQLKSQINANRCVRNAYDVNNESKKNKEMEYAVMPQLQLKSWTTLPPTLLDSSTCITQSNSTKHTNNNWREKANLHTTSSSSLEFRKNHNFKRWGSKRMKSSQINEHDSFALLRNKLYITSETTIRWLEHYLHEALSFNAGATLTCSFEKSEEHNLSKRNNPQQQKSEEIWKSSKFNDIIVADSSFDPCVYTISSNDTRIMSDEGNAKNRITHNNDDAEVIGVKTLEKEEEVNNASPTKNLEEESNSAAVDANNNNNFDDSDEYLLNKQRQLARYLVSYKITRLPKRSGVQLNLEWKTQNYSYHCQQNELNSSISNISSNHDDKAESIDFAEHTHKAGTHLPELQTQESLDKSNVQSISCIIFTSGIVQMTTLSMKTVDDVTKLILLPLLLYHSDFESKLKHVAIGAFVAHLCIVYNVLPFTFSLLRSNTITLQMRSWWNRWQYNSSNALRSCSARIAVGEEVKLALVVRKDLKMGNGKIAAQCAHAAVATVEYMHYLQSLECASSETRTTSPSFAQTYLTPMITHVFGAYSTTTAKTAVSSSSPLSAENETISSELESIQYEQQSPPLKQQQQEEELSVNALHSQWVQWYNAWMGLHQAKIVLQCANEEELLALQRHAKELNLYCHVVRDAGRTQIKSGSKTVLSVGPGPKSMVDAVTGNLKLL